ncbi:hypothetical protein M8C21_022011, partial [Ambrosia artemisiifolia]
KDFTISPDTDTKPVTSISNAKFLTTASPYQRFYDVNKGFLMEPSFDHKDDVAGSMFVDDRKFGANVVKSRVERYVSELGNAPAINLVVDLNKWCMKQSSCNVAESSVKKASDVEVIEKEGEYEFNDLVWGKVKNYPWWPGRIIDPSSATDEAMKHLKKDGFLVAYFGDQTFAFNELHNIKHFRVNFCKLESQSSDEVFVRGVNHALCEAARRVEFGLACLCLSEEVYDEVKSQIVVNSGIRKESSRIDGGDRFSTLNTFNPAMAVDFLQDLAKDPLGMNRLGVSTVRGQLSAFNRWKGYNQLQVNQVLHVTNSALHSKGKPKARGRPRKCKQLFNGGLSPSKKVRSLSDLMSTSNESVSDMEYKPKTRGRKRKAIESNGPVEGSQGQTAVDLMSTSNENVSDVEYLPKKRGRKRKAIESNGSVEGSQSQTTIDLMPTSNASVSDVEYKPKKRGRKRKPIESNGSVEGSQTQTQTAAEFLSQIYLAARNPMEGQHNLDSLVKFSSEYQNHRLIKDKNDEKIANQPETTEPDGFTGNKDSYLTDMTTVTESETSPKSNKENSATALTFKFTNLDTVPSVKKLHEIYRRYGALQETETRVFKKKKCVKLVFERKCDAEAAFSSSGKYSIFGPALVSYRLNFFPKLQKTDTGCRTT